MADAVPQIAEDRKMGLTSATLIAAGNMMGSGFFMLPANLAAIGGIPLIGWLISAMGAIILALVFSKPANLIRRLGDPTRMPAGRLETRSAISRVLRCQCSEQYRHLCCGSRLPYAFFPTLNVPILLLPEKSA